MAGKKLTTRRHFLKSLALGSVFASYWPRHMRMAIASEHTNQHKFDRAIYLFDEKRWYGGANDYPNETLEQYADSIKDAVTDLIILVYGHHSGGTIGWQSSNTELKPPWASSLPKSKTLLAECIAVMKSRGIRVHAAFNTCLAKATGGLFPPRQTGSYLVDPHNPAFQVFITDLMRDCAAINGVAGICLDYIRSDYANQFGITITAEEGEANAESIGNIAKLSYDKCKAVNPNCVISSTTTPYKDVAENSLKLTGRKAIDWANNGYHDILFEMNYGSGGWFNGVRSTGEQGDPPDLTYFHKARELLNDPSKLFIMAGTYRHLSTGEQFPTKPADFQVLLDAIKDVENISFYTGWLFSKEQVALIKESRGS